MKKLLALALALSLFGCIIPSMPGPQAPPAENATAPLQPVQPVQPAPAPVTPSQPAPQPHTVLVPYEVNETYVEEVLVKERVLVGPQNVRVQNLSVARVNEVFDSDSDCSASVVVKNPNPFGVYFSGSFKGIMDSAPANNMHFNVDNVVSQVYVSANSEAALPSGTYHPAAYMGPYGCRIDLSSVSFTILEQDGIHYVEIENTIWVNKTRTVIKYRNETV